MNPFPFGSVTRPDQFIGRAKEIRRISGRIAGGGQSVAITAEPGMGMGALLRYLSAPEKYVELYGEIAQHLVFQYIDTTTFGSAFTQPQFWWLALASLTEKLPEINIPALTIAYETSKNEGFGVYGLEKLFARLQVSGWRLVLLIDEFDNLLAHPVLNQSEFYGGLRSLASRYESLTIITASRQPLEKLNEATQEYSRMGSPYFNFMSQVTLGALTEKETMSLLARGDEHFTREDKEFLHFIADGHPALLQAAANTLWEVCEDGEDDHQMRWETASRGLLEAANPILTSTWRNWSPETRKAVAIIALDSIPRLVAGKEFDLDVLLSSFSAYGPEVDELKRRGFLETAPEARTGFRLQAQVMLWWLACELIRATRPQDGNDLGQWLRDQQWDGLIKGEEKSQLSKAITSLGCLLKTGTEVFIKASAEGFAKGLTTR